MTAFAGGLEAIASHWDQVVAVVKNKLEVTAYWDVKNLSNVEGKVYMELEIVRPQAWLQLTPQRLVATLPGVGNFSTEMDRDKVLNTSAPVIAVPAGGTARVPAYVALAATAVPDGIYLDVRVRLRRVDDEAESSDPTKVGPVIANGEHKQNDVIRVAREASLEASGLPGIFRVGS